MDAQQQLTQHQSQYHAWLLTRRVAGDSVESLASTLVDSQGDLNPHQVEANLLALTKLNFNACIYGDGVPVTLRCADAVGEILTIGRARASCPRCRSFTTYEDAHSNAHI